MPCYEVNLISVEFKVSSIDTLKSIGAIISVNKAYVDDVIIDLENGTAKAVKQESINAVKRKYSIAVVKEMSKKQMWNISQKENKLTLTKW